MIQNNIKHSTRLISKLYSRFGRTQLAQAPTHQNTTGTLLFHLRYFHGTQLVPIIHDPYLRVALATFAAVSSIWSWRTESGAIAMSRFYRMTPELLLVSLVLFTCSAGDQHCVCKRFAPLFSTIS